MNWKIYISESKLARGMQIALLFLFLSGVYAGSSKVILNSFIGLLVSFLPAILERDYNITLNLALETWITAAVFFHALGSMWFYTNVGWWDHLTHSLSASVLAALGYTTIRIVDLYYQDEVHLPRRYMFVFIILTIMAFGVVWELLEFGLDIISLHTGIDMPLAQHGLEDTMKDMTFNTIGAVIVGLLGHAYLTDTAEQILEKFQQKTE